MITLTPAAVGKVKEFIEQQPDSYAGVRLAVTAGGCSGFEYKMNLERTEQDGDQVFPVDGIKVFVDEQSLLYLDGTEVDFVENIRGSGFAFRNPNVKGTCGCGESFQA